MRVRAFILLLCLSVYYLDVIAAVDVCNRIEEKSASCEQSESSCSNKPGNQCPEQRDDGCSTICVTCPLYYNAVMAHGFSMTLFSIQLRNNFPRYEVNFVNEFFTKTWKPPNRFFI